MKALLHVYLEKECDKHILRHNEYLYELNESIRRKSLRLDAVVTKKVVKPPHWALDERFDPFKTRVKKKLALYSFTLARKILRGQYYPELAARYSVAKEDGSKREVCVFQLPDAAVSNLIYRSLLGKNLNRLSAYSYAYRPDKGPHDAIHDVATDWRATSRVYTAEVRLLQIF